MKLPAIVVLLLFSVQTVQGQDYALEQLENSPRHHEWIEIGIDGRNLYNFVVYPETSDSVPVVIVIHENRGLTDWVRSFADQIAEAGYIAIAPDLLSGFDEEHERTTDFESSDAARDALYRLDPDQVINDLIAVQNYAGMLSSASGIVVAGFCWGGSQTFRFATYTEGIEASLVFYGSAPDEDEPYEYINAPVYGFYGGNDQRINSTIPATEERMERFGNIFEYEIYDGAGHAYMRSGDSPDASVENKQARDRSWERLIEILKGI
ncbi:hypothetical protein BH23BAC3_BH23BAC3_28800 [soil metagenome]